jgi:hypothetical protein
LKKLLLLLFVRIAVPCFVIQAPLAGNFGILQTLDPAVKLLGDFFTLGYEI